MLAPFNRDARFEFVDVLLERRHRRQRLGVDRDDFVPAQDDEPEDFPCEIIDVELFEAPGRQDAAGGDNDCVFFGWHPVAGRVARSARPRVGAQVAADRHRPSGLGKREQGQERKQRGNAKRSP